jgi:SNF2 family DNA or RNA helicase
MEILRHKLQGSVLSNVINVKIISYNMTRVLYLVQTEDKKDIYIKHYLESVYHKYLYFEIVNKCLLWKFDFKCTKISSFYHIEIVISIDLDLIDEYKNTSLGFNYLLLMKDKELPQFYRFDENISYLPYCDIMNPHNNFQISLYDYQKKSLNKMIQLENKSTEFIINYSSKLSFGDCEFNYDPIKSIISNDIRQIKMKVSGGILADEMGLGKTITSLALVATNKSTYTDNFKCSRLYKTQKIYSKATIIVCPSHLTKQWEKEAKAAIKDAKILIINTKKDHEKLTFNDFIINDIIITSHSFLMNFKYYPTLYYGRISPCLYKPEMRARKLGTALKDIISNNNIDIIKDTPLPIFEFFYFHRLILDEGHEIFGDMLGNSALSRYMSDWLSSIDSNTYWFVSGSPFVNMNGVQNAFKFIDMSLNDMTDNFTFKYRNSHTDVNSIDNIFKEDILKKYYIINNILEKICIRHKKSDIENLNILGYDEHIEWIEFTELERNIYNSKVF